MAVGGTGVFVAVGGIGVDVGDCTGVSVGFGVGSGALTTGAGVGTGVFVGGTGVSVGAAVGGIGVGVRVTNGSAVGSSSEVHPANPTAKVAINPNTIANTPSRDALTVLIRISVIE